MKINVTPNFATMVRGHGKTRAYFHHFKIMERATCPCNSGDQTIDHLLYQCTLFHTPRELVRSKVLKIRNWPTSKQELTTNRLKAFLTYTNSTDFEQFCKHYYLLAN
jgi:hypothetical protein